MALFKVFRGESQNLDSVTKVDGYAYFCTDDGSFWIDHAEGEEIVRTQINKQAWTEDIEAAVAASDEIYIGEGDMPENATLQIILDGSNEEEMLKNELKKYIDFLIESQINQLSSEKVNKNQGAENVGKTLAVGTDGNLVLVDMPEGGASGDVIGTIDESNNILLTGKLANGTYTIKYENEDGSYTDIGTLEVGEMSTEINLFTTYTPQLNKRWSNSSRAWSAQNGSVGFELPMADVAGKTMRFSGFKQTYNSTAVPTWYFVDDSNVAVTDGFTIFDVATNEGDNTYSWTVSNNTGATKLMAFLPIKDEELFESDLATVSWILVDENGESSSDEPNQIVNLVLTSLDTDGEGIYNDIGYKNGAYISSTGEDTPSTDGTDTTTVATGFIPYSFETLYIKGATINVDTSHCRAQYITADFKSRYQFATGSMLWNDYFTIEELATNYYKVTPKTTFTGIAYIRFSLIGTGENLIISTKEIP